MGGLWGSFANVCIYRLPLDKGVALGRSYCTKCKKQIAWYDNIPIISFLLIQGKCRKCKKKDFISIPTSRAIKHYKFCYYLFYTWCCNYYTIINYFSFNFSYYFFYRFGTSYHP